MQRNKGKTKPGRWSARIFGFLATVTVRESSQQNAFEWDIAGLDELQRQLDILKKLRDDIRAGKAFLDSDCIPRTPSQKSADDPGAFKLLREELVTRSRGTMGLKEVKPAA